MSIGARYGLILRTTLAAALAACALAACGAESPAATPTDQPPPTALDQPPATPAAQPASSAPPSRGVWRADVALGPRPGDRATDATLALADGSSTTIEEAAAGRSVLLYFFATW